MMILIALTSLALLADDAAPATPVGQAERYLTTPLPDAGIEALAVDIDAERLYLGGTTDGSLYSVSLESPRAPQRLAGSQEGVGPVFGLAIDGRARILYAATGAVSGGEAGDGPALIAYDLLTEEVSARHTVPDAGRISDVFAQDGIIYATDAEAGRIYRLPEPGGVLEIYAQNAGFGTLEGLALSRGALFAADRDNGLWRIDPVSRDAVLVEAIEGSLAGFDGLATDSYGELYGIRNGAEPHGLFHIALQGFGDRARVTPLLTGHRDFAEPATVRISDNRFFILANAQRSNAPAGVRRDPVILFKPVP